MQTNYNNKKILLVDDEKSIVDMYGTIFELENFNCIKANSVHEAVKRLDEEKVDAIISDINMPELNGFSFRINLLNNDRTANIPFIFLTSVDDNNSINRGYELSVDEYIPKTTSPLLVVKKVKSILERTNKENKKVVSDIVSAVKETNEDLIKVTPPQIPGFIINQVHIPFEDIPGGDFIDYVNIDEENTAVVLCDTQGKKWGAWLVSFAYMSYIRSIIRSQLLFSEPDDPALILDKINKIIYNDEKLSTFFSSITILIINNKTKLINYCGAGDLPLFVSSNKKTRKHFSEGIVVGLAEEGGYFNQKIKLDEGESLVMITDGAIDIDIGAKEKLGIKKFEEMLLSVENFSNLAEALKEKLAESALTGFTDDLTIIEIKHQDGK